MPKALVIVDYQNEWEDKSSDYYVGNLKGRIKKLNRLIANCRQKRIPVIFTAHVEPGNKKAFAEGSVNVEIIKGIDFHKGSDALIIKNRVSPFYRTKLESKLRKLDVDELIITGILSNLCVRSIVSDAYDRDYKIIVITDTCAAMSEKIHNFTMKDLKNTRPEISFRSVDEFIKAV